MMIEPSPPRVFAWQEKPSKPEPTRAASYPCSVCGTAVSVTIPARSRPDFGDRWPTCPACQTVIEEAGGDPLRARAAFLAELLPDDDDIRADDPACREAARLIVCANRLEEMGVPATHEDAMQKMTGMIFRATPKENAGTAGRWEHVSADNRRLLREALTRERRRLRPRRHRAGPCFVCGVRKALRWHGPYQVTPGISTTRWVACGDCKRQVTDKAGTTMLDGLSTWVTAAAFGVTASMGKDFLRPYAATRSGTTPADDPGCAERFGYVSDDDRLEALRRWPRIVSAAPAHLRQRLEREQRVEQAKATMNATPTRPPGALNLGDDRPRVEVTGRDLHPWER